MTERLDISTQHCTIERDGRVVARDGRLVCLLDSGAEFTSSLKKVTVEQAGPVRAVAQACAAAGVDDGDVDVGWVVTGAVLEAVVS